MLSEHFAIPESALSESVFSSLPGHVIPASESAFESAFASRFCVFEFSELCFPSFRTACFRSPDPLLNAAVFVVVLGNEFGI